MAYEITKINVDEIYKEYSEDNNDVVTEEVREKYHNLQYAMEEYISALVEDSTKRGIKYAWDRAKKLKMNAEIDELLNELVMSDDEVREIVEDEMREMGTKEMCELYKLIVRKMDDEKLSISNEYSGLEKMLIIGKEIYRFGFGKAIFLVNESMKMNKEESLNGSPQII